MNPVNMLQTFIQTGGSPKKFLENLTFKNPVVNNLMGLAKSGDTQQIETFARNLFKEKGRDFDKEFSEFRKQFK